MDDFDELAGRIEALGRALVLLAEMMERETCMDGPTLSQEWRQAMPEPRRSRGNEETVRRTLAQLADWLDDFRSRRQAAEQKHRQTQSPAAPPSVPHRPDRQRP